MAGRGEPSASKRIDERIRELVDWRGKALGKVRRLIQRTDPDVVEEWKWGIPVWSHGGLICTGETYKDKIKLTFAKGASLDDPAGLFNSSLGGNVRRAIDIHETDDVDETALADLIRAAVALNLENSNRATKRATTKATKGVARKPSKATLLSGGNPQIAKGEGELPVQAYIAAVPGWKREVARHLDALVTRAFPSVRKAVKWNSPFYGVEGRGWFLSYHCFTKYVKVTFFNGTSLRPVPPGGSKHPEVRYLDIHEEDELDEHQMLRWVKQASRLPGWGKV